MPRFFRYFSWRLRIFRWNLCRVGVATLLIIVAVLFLSSLQAKPKYEPRIHSLSLSKDDTVMCLKMESQVNGLIYTRRVVYHFGRDRSLPVYVASGIDGIDNNDVSHHDTSDVTLVTQLSCNRIQFMLLIMEHWGGPMSVAVYCKNINMAAKFLRLMKTHSVGYQSHITLIMINDDHEPPPDTSTTLYPINYLRNVALNSAITDYVFLCDADFIPSLGLYRSSVKAANSLLMNTTENRALVVAAFEEKVKMQSFPLSKSELHSLYIDKIVSQFHAKFNHGHGPTNYKKWFKAQSPYGINWGRDYEPYVIVNRKTVPKYDESFIGYGFNKIVHIAELQAMKYKFIVLPNEFVLHRLHSVTVDRTLIDAKGQVRNCIKMKYLLFMWDYLPSKYGNGWEDYKAIKNKGTDKPHYYLTI